MREEKYNILGEKLSGQYTDVETLLDKINKQIESGTLQVSNDSILSPMKCLNWSLTYKIYDCLYEHGSLTPTEIDSIINDRPPGIINHALELMSLIGITKPVTHENLTSGDLPRKGLSILPILHEHKKWELTESIREEKESKRTSD